MLLPQRKSPPRTSTPVLDLLELCDVDFKQTHLGKLPQFPLSLLLNKYVGTDR